LKFNIEGAARIAGTDNGYQADTVSLKSFSRNCWKGMALVIIQSIEKREILHYEQTVQDCYPEFYP
jgi:beta-galactosidase